MSEQKIPRIEDDEIIIAAIREGRHADDIYLLDCPYCGVPSYYNQGSHFTCRVCDKTMDVSDEMSEESITLAEYWEEAPYPCDEQKWFCPVCGSTTHQHCSRGCANCDDPKSPMPRYASTFCGTCGKSFCAECMERHKCEARVQ